MRPLKRLMGFRLIYKFFIFAFVFCVINVAALMYFGQGTAEAREHAAVQAPARGDPIDETSSRPSRAAAGLAAQASQGVIYAPRDVVDISRLVLETSRENTNHVTHHIEVATTVIVVFFSVLGALGAAFGLHKMDDLDTKAAGAVKTFQDRLDNAQSEVAELQASHKQALEGATVELNRRIMNLTQVVLARVDLQLTKRTDVTDAQRARALQQVCATLEPALADKGATGLTGAVRVRALTDLAWAQKRLGRFDVARNAIIEALNLARTEAVETLGLLTFNAACYSALLGNFPDALKYLEEAVSHEERYKIVAPDEPDFTALRQKCGDEFTKIIQ